MASSSSPAQVNVLAWSISFGACLGSISSFWGSYNSLALARAAKACGVRLGHLRYVRMALPLSVAALVMAHGYSLLAFYYAKYGSA